MMSQEIPEEFICPLTLQVFEYPLMSRHGMNYERAAIVEWLDRGNNSCPLTRKPLDLAGLINNRPLKQRIKKWQAENSNHQGTADSKQATEGWSRMLDKAGLLKTPATPASARNKRPTSNDTNNRAASADIVRSSRREHHWFVLLGRRRAEQ